MSKENVNVFIDGTNNPIWRDKIKSGLKVPYYEAIYSDGRPMNSLEKDLCNVHFYCITKDSGWVFLLSKVYSSHARNDKKTFVHIIPTGFSPKQLKSLRSLVNSLRTQGGYGVIESTSKNVIDTLNHLVV
jgi:hypothetical protein